jgi:hypothetical protein
MDLKTVVVNKLSRAGLRKYPLVFSQSLEFLPDLQQKDQTMQQVPQNNVRTHAGNTHTLSTSLDSHPLVIGHNPNYTNTTNLTSKLRTNEALAGSAKPSPLQHQNTGNKLPISFTKTKSFYRSDSAASTDSLNLNLMEFRAQPPTIHYPSSLSEYDNNSFFDDEASFNSSHSAANNPASTAFSISGGGNHPQKNDLLAQIIHNNPGLAAVHAEKSSISSSSHTQTGGGGIPKLHKNNGINSLNQPSLLTINTFQPPHHLQQFGFPNESSVITDGSSIATLADHQHHQTSPPNVNKLQRSNSYLNNNANQDVINGIVYNYRANNHYNNLIYKTKLSQLEANEEGNQSSSSYQHHQNFNDPITVKKEYDKYYHVIDDTISQNLYSMDSLSVTSLTQQQQQQQQQNNSPMRSTHKSSRSPTHWNSSKQGTKRVFPEIDKRLLVNRETVNSNVLLSDRHSSRSSNRSSSDAIRKLQKELF